jgi:hypothetical protein
MSLVGTPAIRLLESELFFLPFIEERANGRIVVGPIEHHATDDLNTGAQRDRVCRKPAGRMYGANDIFFASNEPHVERISRNAGAGACNHGQSSQAGFMLVMSPQGGEHDVSQHKISDRDGRESAEPSSSDWEQLHSIAPALAYYSISTFSEESPRSLA